MSVVEYLNCVFTYLREAKENASQHLRSYLPTPTPINASY
uniref:Uncharacterized protein n=1 Tax=Nelumbo nucifera TaxID=4432 RepID=A0A822ZK53_NELNU|nr:TPA_asm: hypothetical protein HUJ06_016411 [Nelumbo nucifera]